MIADKEVTDRGEINFTGGADVTPIVDVLYGSLYQFAVALTRSESDAADLVQQTFLSLIQRLHQIRDFSKIKCWLFTTLRRNFLQGSVGAFLPERSLVQRNWQSSRNTDRHSDVEVVERQRSTQIDTFGERRFVTCPLCSTLSPLFHPDM